jgi:hypothetical protein
MRRYDGESLGRVNEIHALETDVDVCSMFDGDVCSMALSHQGDQLATGYEYGKVKVWTLQQGIRH